MNVSSRSAGREMHKLTTQPAAYQSGSVMHPGKIQVRSRIAHAMGDAFDCFELSFHGLQTIGA
jgi:hypothetical protein